MRNMPDHTDLIFQWEVRSWSRALPLWERYLKALPAGRPSALALGERDGGLSLLLAQHGCNVICSDLHGPTERAKAMHETLGWEWAMDYRSIDALDIPLADGSLDVVVFKSMLGALSTKERQMQAVREMYRVLKPSTADKPGGVLLFAENLQGTPLHRWLRKRFVPWDHYWRYLDQGADRDLFAPFTRLDDATTGLLANLGRSERQRDLLARVDSAILPLVPRSMRTIWYGAAIKA